MADDTKGVPKVTRQRMAAAESDEGGASAAVDNPPAAQTAAPPQLRFTREYTPAERAIQQKKLAEILRKRGG